MSDERKSILNRVFTLAWQFIKKNGFNRSEALKTAWANIKLKTAMRQRIVKFYYQKFPVRSERPMARFKRDCCHQQQAMDASQTQAFSHTTTQRKNSIAASSGLTCCRLFSDRDISKTVT